ncbi:MAG: 3'-5' exonuclease [Flavobacteriaceae bacterium]|nr:3'-5' exonuclease [Flavobacteriaceae bacterium]
MWNLNWFNQNKLPDFWKRYSDHFRSKLPLDIDVVRFVVLDTETTGLDPVKDRILSIGCVGLHENKISVADSLEIYLSQDQFNTETVAVHGLLKNGKFHKQTEQEAIEQLLPFLKNAVIVAHHADFDLTVLNNTLRRLSLPKLKNKVLDTGVLFKKTTLCTSSDTHYSLDDLCDLFSIKKHDRHTAAGDAFLTAILFLKITAQLKKANPALDMKDLLFNKPTHGLI